MRRLPQTLLLRTSVSLHAASPTALLRKPNPRVKVNASWAKPRPAQVRRFTSSQEGGLGRGGEGTHTLRGRAGLSVPWSCGSQGRELGGRGGPYRCYSSQVAPAPKANKVTQKAASLPVLPPAPPMLTFSLSLSQLSQFALADGLSSAPRKTYRTPSGWASAYDFMTCFN